MSEKQDGSGNRPFHQLGVLVKRAGLKLKAQEDRSPIQAIKKPRAEPPSQTDDEVFRQAMEEVTRCVWPHSPTSSDSPPALFLDNAVGEELRLMKAALDGDPPIMVSDHPEYIEGWIGVAGKRFLPDLRNGMYSIQGQLDLHGLDRSRARAAVEDFITRMSRFRSCCVKIVHGRGINSPNERAILKENLQRWLSTRRMSRHVVAYASAPLQDGGVGAVYVLLRRQ